MKGEVPAKGTSPFFLIIIKFGTFFTHFEMILLYPEPYLSYFWCRIKRNRTNIMKITIKYICTGLSLCACTCLVNNLPAQAETTNTAAVSATETGWDRQSIMEVARRVADWQIKDYPENKYAKSEPRGWIAGALYMGMFDWAELSGDNTYYDWLRKIFNRQSWQVANRMYHADDVCIAQTYIDFYNKEKNENMLKPTIARADWVLNNPSNGSMDLDYSKGSTIERWTWCDALFMAPGVYTRLYTLTGNRKYMHFADSEFRATYNHLYDKDEDLFYRDSRYIGQKEANGKKVFWGRGNGWVIGGLAEILKTLPAEDTEFRPFYLELYKEMSDDIQDIIDAAKTIHANGVEIVAVSLGADGSLAVGEEGIFRAIVPKIDAVNTVGCGDSMIAGFALGLSEGLSLEETLRRASAISAAAAMREETGFFVMEDMEKLLPQIVIQKLYNTI